MYEELSESFDLRIGFRQLVIRKILLFVKNLTKANTKVIATVGTPSSTQTVALLKCMVYCAKLSRSEEEDWFR